MDHQHWPRRQDRCAVESRDVAAAFEAGGEKIQSSIMRARRWRTRSAWFVVLTSLHLALVDGANAQSLPNGCDSKLVDLGKKLAHGYAARAGGYCDGTVSYDNSGELQLVSYTLGPVRFATAEDSLIIEQAQAPTSLKIAAIDKRPGADYRLDAFMTRPLIKVALANAITPKKIPADSLGVLAWQTYAGKREFVPIVAGAPPGERTTAVLVLRSAAAIAQATWHLCDPGGTCDKEKLLAQGMLEGNLKTLSFQRTNSTQHKVLQVNVEEANGNKSKVIYSVLLP